MSPTYRQGEAYPQPSPAYLLAPPNVEPQPIWLEPRELQPHYYYREAQPHYYYRETPKRPWPDEWRYSEGRPYLHHYPAEGGYFYYPPKYVNSPPRFYEPDGMDFGRERFYGPDGREFRRDFRPIYVDAPSFSAPGPYAYRPFRSSEQFRHPDEYPMRFVPASYGPSEERKAHCCGCPNHVCNPETKTVKETEPKQITDGKSEEELKPKSHNLQDFQGPYVVLPPGWRNRASSPERKDHIAEKEEHPVYWIPVNWNRNDRERSGDRKGEDKEQSPVYWFPMNWMGNDRTQEHDPRMLRPLASNTSSQDEKENKKDATLEGKIHPFPLFSIPEGRWNVANTNSQEESKSPNSQASCEDTKKTNGVESKPVILREIGKDDEKQRPAEVKKETKARDIPVKQLEEEKPAQSRKAEEKSSQPQKTEEKEGDNHHKTSSPKASKLPPVCLRVDPPPGKKKSNGKGSSSRSPSPPRKSEHPKERATSSAPEENANLDASSKIFVGAKKAEENAKMNASTKEDEKLDASSQANIGRGKPMAAENDNMQTKESEIKKCELGKDQAALKIQAVYRGYQVRRLQPLRKLRDIAKIREQVKELKQQISSPEFVGELSRDEKVKGRTHETLMGLLLQLDTIQGVHSVVRDVRKAAAREIVLLQEKLDSWTEVACNNNMQQQETCMQVITENNENNVGVEEEIIEKNEKDWEATENSDKTLLNSNNEDQRVDNEASQEDEKAHDKQDSFEVKRETNDEDRKETPVKEEKRNEEKKEGSIKEHSDVVVEQEDYATEHSENVQENALLNPEAPEISENVEKSALAEVEMRNHDQDADVSGQMISTPDNTLKNINQDKEGMSEEIVSVSNSGEGMSEKIVSVSNSGDLYLKNMKDKVVEKPEPQIDADSVMPQDSDVQTEVSPLSNLVQGQEISDVGGNSISLDQSTGKKAFEGGEVLCVPEAEPEKNISKEETEIPYSEAIKTETEDLQNVVAEEIVGDKQLESSVVVSSQAISDITSGSRSDGCEENNMISLEDPPVEDNASGKREFAVALAQETYNPTESMEFPTTEDPSDVNSKDEFHTGNEELQENHAPKCSGLSGEMEFTASDSAEKLVMEPFSPTNNSHSEILNQLEANIARYGSKQEEENWEEENEKLRKMVEKLVESGKKQMSTIAQLTDKIKSLESKLSKGNGKKKARARHVKLRSNMVGRNTNNASAVGC